jgi:ketosteroid isomerase-like protein
LPPRNLPIFTTPEAVEEAFYDALSRSDLVGLMSLWADDEDVACVHPNGPRLVGLEAIRESWRQILSAGTLQVRPADVQVYSGAVLSVHHLVEQIANSGEEPLECSATNVYIKLAVGWRMVLHHSSSGVNVPLRPSAAALH